MVKGERTEEGEKGQSKTGEGRERRRLCKEIRDGDTDRCSCFPGSRLSVRRCSGS